MILIMMLELFFVMLLTKQLFFVHGHSDISQTYTTIAASNLTYTTLPFPNLAVNKIDTVLEYSMML